jgi:hypothetical protein
VLRVNVEEQAIRHPQLFGLMRACRCKAQNRISPYDGKIRRHVDCGETGPGGATTLWRAPRAYSYAINIDNNRDGKADDIEKLTYR